MAAFGSRRNHSARRFGRRATFVAAALLVTMPVVVSTHVAGAVGSPPPAGVSSGWEDATHWSARDEGYSVALPNGQSLWIFGDSPMYVPGTPPEQNQACFLHGSTAIKGPTVQLPQWSGANPPSYTEIDRGTGTHCSNQAVNGAGSPSQFLGDPVTYLPGSTEQNPQQCTPGRSFGGATASYSARWPIGATLIPINTNRVLITFIDVCVFSTANGGDLRVEGWGYAEYNWTNNTFPYPPADIYVPTKAADGLGPKYWLASPVFFTTATGDWKVALFGTDLCGAGTQAADGDWYCSGGQFYASSFVLADGDNGNWLAIQLAVLPDLYPPTPITTPQGYGNFGGPVSVVKITDQANPSAGGVRMIVQTSQAGKFVVFKSTAPASAWQYQSDGQLPACNLTPPDTCPRRGIIGHAEASGSGNLWLSYVEANAVLVHPHPTGQQSKYVPRILFPSLWTAVYVPRAPSY